MDETERGGRFEISGGTFHGPVAFGNRDVTQYYTAAPAAQFQRELAEIRRLLEEQGAALPDRQAAEQAVVVIEEQVSHPGGDRGRIETALRQIAAQVTAGTDLARAIGTALALVARHWPF